LILRVFALNGRLLAAGDALVQDLGLTSARWQVLGAIALAHAPQPVASLARTMGLSRQAVQRTVNELALKGLLEFQPNPHHQTAQLVVLTDKGTLAYNAAHARQAPWADAIAADLRATDLAIAERVLSRLTDRLDDIGPARLRFKARERPTNVRPQRRSHGQAR
jgi:DNA-binding MarR family transcriptional regulator